MSERGTNARPAESRALPWAIASGLCVLLLFHGLSYWINVDDAFIAFRYADNLSDGLGLVFNPGERVEGYTDFLWVVLLAGTRTAGASTPVAAQVLGGISAVAGMFIMYWTARRRFGLGPWIAALPCLVVCASSATAMWMGGGLETALYTTLFTAALALTLADMAERPRIPLSGILFGLAALTRPEAFGLFLVLVAAMLVLRLTNLRTAILVTAGFLLVFGPHMLFRLGFYGYPWPNTFYAKTGLSKDMLLDGLQYAGAFLLHHGVWAMPAIVGLWLGPWKETRVWLAVVAILGAAGSYIVIVGGDIYPYSRFCVPYLPWIALITCAGMFRIEQLARKKRWSVYRRAAPGFATAVVALSAAISGYVMPDLSYGGAMDTLKSAAPVMKAYGEWFRDNRPSDTVLAISSLGRVPYYSELKTIDMLGLADTHIAHREMELDRGILGHQKYDSEYVLSRQPDIVAIEYGTTDEMFDPRKDLDTEKIYRRTRVEKGWWPALEDLLGRREFRLHYVPQVAEVEPGKVLVFFERDAQLEVMRAEAKKQPNDPRVHFDLAIQYRRQGLLDDAIGSLRRASALNPDHAGTLLNIGFLQYEARRYEEALAEFLSLRERLPQDPSTQYGVAISLHHLGRYEEAIPEWEAFLAMGPNSAFTPKAIEFLERAHQAAGRPYPHDVP